jgi:hypothetical protein
MIRYENIEHEDGAAKLVVHSLDTNGGDLRPIVWEIVYGDLLNMLMWASAEILHETKGDISLSREFPGMPKALEPLAKALMRIDD